jgi:hypothetical protein
VSLAIRAMVAGALLASASVVGAQTAESRTRARVERRMQRGAQQPQIGRGAFNERQALQRRVRLAFNELVRRQLNLNPAQMQTLQRTDQKYEQQRRALVLGEREARLNLAAAMQDSTGHPDQDKIAQYLDQLVRGQRQRAELLESEQKEFSTFLTPLQRAQYFALKERLSKKLVELRADSTGGRAGRGGLPPIEP